MSSLARITIYPIKSLDGVERTSCRVLSSGSLEDDRRFAFQDESGRFVNGKRYPTIHQVRATFEWRPLRVRLSRPDVGEVEFSLTEDRGRLNRWMSEAMGIKCQLVESREGGFPDDTDAPGPTLISTASLAAVVSWFPELTLEETRRRFRANLEIEATEPMVEDALVAPAGEAPLGFQLGETRWFATGICQRCPVPSRDSRTGEPLSGFQKRFARQREATLPLASPRGQFDHFYRLAINTRPAPGFAGGRVRLGDELLLDR